MEDNTKKIIRRDVITIAQLCNKYDCSKPEIAKKIYSVAIEKSIFESSIGKSFQQRMVSVANGETSEDLCLLCRKNRASNHAVCPECLQKITNLQAKQTMNSTKTNQTNIENGAVNKEKTPEIEKHTKEFTQNVASTTQEISTNVKNVVNEDQKKIFDEMNGESAQEIKHKAFEQAGDTSNGIRKVANGANANGNDVNSNVPQSHNAETYQNESVNNPQPDKNNGNTIEEKTKRKKGKGIIAKIFIPLVILFYILKILLESQSTDTTSRNINQSFTFTEAEAVEWLNNDLGQIGWNIHTVQNGDSIYLVSDETIEGTVADKTILDACYKFEIDDNGYVSHIFVLLPGNEISGNAFVLAMAGIKGCCDGSITGEKLKEIYAKTISDGEYIYNNLKLEYVYNDDSNSLFVISPKSSFDYNQDEVLKEPNQNDMSDKNNFVDNQDEALNGMYSLYDKNQYDITFEDMTYPCCGMYEGEVGKWIGDMWTGDSITAYVFVIQSKSSPENMGVIWLAEDGRAIAYGPMWGNDGSTMYRIN